MIQWLKKATNRNFTGNYKFHIKYDPQNPDTSSTLSITTFNDKSQSVMLPCHYKWYRVRNGLRQQSFKFKGNSYLCDPSDLGFIIQVQVISNDPQYSGKAQIQFGPIKLANDIKKHLMDTLTNGFTFIKASICSNKTYQKQCQLKIFEDMIKICHIQSQLNFTFNYTIYQPKIQIAPKQQNKIWIIFQQNYQQNPQIFLNNLFANNFDHYSINNNQCTLQIKFINKLVRDKFLFTLKIFFIKKQLKNSIIIHKLQQSSFNQNQPINLLLQLQSLRSDLTRLYYLTDQKDHQKLTLLKQKTKLQKQLQQIITTYTRIIDQKYKNTLDINQSYLSLTNKKDQMFGKKYQNLQRENVNLNQRIKLLTAQIDQIRFNSITNKNQPPLTQFFNNNTSTIKFKPPQKPQSSSFYALLDQFTQPKQTQQNQFLSSKLQKTNEQKIQLQKKLQRSFKIIQSLQKKLKNPNFNHNVTAVNFYSGSRIQVPLQTSAITSIKQIDTLQKQYNRLLSQNQNLKRDNKKYQGQLLNASSKIIFLQSNQQQFKYNDKQNQLIFQNQSLKKQVISLKQIVKNQQIKNDHLMREKVMLEIKIQQINKQLILYKKNQSVLNRSQNLSIQIDSHNQQQIRVLRQHNQVLINENQKLSKTIQKCMNEAKQNIKLRRQILQLKQKYQQNLMNPQRSQNKSQFSKSMCSQQYSICQQKQII